MSQHSSSHHGAACNICPYREVSVYLCVFSGFKSLVCSASFGAYQELSTSWPVLNTVKLLVVQHADPSERMGMGVSMSCKLTTLPSDDLEQNL
jgi:hypothetical protein